MSSVAGYQCVHASRYRHLKKRAIRFVGKWNWERLRRHPFRARGECQQRFDSDRVQRKLSSLEHASVLRENDVVCYELKAILKQKVEDVARRAPERKEA